MGSGDAGSGFTANGFKVLPFFETFGEFSALDSRGGVGKVIILFFGIPTVFAAVSGCAGLKSVDADCSSVGPPSTIPLI